LNFESLNQIQLAPFFTHYFLTKDNPKTLLPMHIRSDFNTILSPPPAQMKDNVPLNYAGEQTLKPKAL